jgi:hypothetical protein
MATPELRAFRAGLLAAASDRAAGLMRSLHPDPEYADARGIALSAQVLTGGIAELLVGATTTGTPTPPDQFVSHLTRAYTAAATIDVPGGR